MRANIIPLLACPRCQGALTLVKLKEEAETEDGALSNLYVKAPNRILTLYRLLRTRLPLMVAYKITEGMDRLYALKRTHKIALY